MHTEYKAILQSRHLQLQTNQTMQSPFTSSSEPLLPFPIPLLSNYLLEQTPVSSELLGFDTRIAEQLRASDLLPRTLEEEVPLISNDNLLDLSLFGPSLLVPVSCLAFRR